MPCEVHEHSILRHSLFTQPVNLSQDILTSDLLVREHAHVVMEHLFPWKFEKPIAELLSVRFGEGKAGNHSQLVLTHPDCQDPHLLTTERSPENGLNRLPHLRLV